MLVLALLVVRRAEADVLAKWTSAVLDDSEDYVSRSAWKPPKDWRLVDSFRAWLIRCKKEDGPSGADKQATGAAAALADVAGRWHATIGASAITPYLRKLFDVDGKCLLGVDARGARTIAHGAVRRATYLIPRVAALINEKRDVLADALAAGEEVAIDRAQEIAPGVTPGAKVPSPTKQVYREENESLKATVDTQKKRLAEQADALGHARKRSATTRENMSAAIDRRVDRRAATIEAGVADVRAKAAAMKEQLKSAKAALNAKKRYAPSHVKALEKQLREALAQLETFAARIVEFEKQVETIHNTITPWVPTLRTGKKSGRGASHEPKLNLLIQKLITLGVRPNVMNEVRLFGGWSGSSLPTKSSFVGFCGAVRWGRLGAHAFMHVHAPGSLARSHALASDQSRFWIATTSAWMRAATAVMRALSLHARFATRIASFGRRRKVIASCAESIVGEGYMKERGMQLPTENYIRSMRADIGALHRTVHALASSAAKTVRSVQFDASPCDGEEWIVAPEQLVTEVFGEDEVETVETWYGGAMRTADFSAAGEAAVVVEHAFTRKTKYIEALRARLDKAGEPAAVAAAALPTKTAAAHLLAKLAGGVTETDNASPAIAAQREVSVERGEFGCGYDSRRSISCDWTCGESLWLGRCRRAMVQRQM